MKVNWIGDLLVYKMEDFFKEQGDIFPGVKFDGFPCKFNVDAYLDGYWGEGMHTMNEQAILLGIPSLQLQIPLAVRKKLYKNQPMRQKLISILQKLYQFVIIPDCIQKKRRYKVSKQIGDKITSTIKSGQECEEVLHQTNIYERKEEGSHNTNRFI